MKHDQPMNTKLNAEELANKRWAYRVDTGFGKAIQDGCKQGYAAAICEHSQPLADKLDAVTRERDELLNVLRNYWNDKTGNDKHCGHDYDCICASDMVRAILAKYPKQ